VLNNSDLVINEADQINILPIKILSGTAELTNESMTLTLKQKLTANG